MQTKIVQPVRQAVPKVMKWVDRHQREIVIGLGIAAGVAAVILSGGAATPLVAAAWVAGSAAVAGGVAALGTVGLNAYFGRSLGENVLRNLGYAAGAAVVTAGLGLAIAGGVVQQGVYSVGNAVARVCLQRPTVCGRIGAGLSLWDKVEEIGLRLQLGIQTARGDPAAMETALQLQLEQLDGGVPGNTTFREIYENTVTLFARHDDEAAQIASVALRHSNDVLEEVDGFLLRVDPEAAEEIAEELEAALGRKVWFSSNNGVVYVSRPTKAGLGAVARLRTALQSRVDDETIAKLIEEVAMASTRGSGNRVVLGAWKPGGGYIGEAVERGGVFFDTGEEVWEMPKRAV